MRTVSTRDLRANLSSELSDLPFLLTKYGMVIACVHNIWNEGESGKESPFSVHKAEVNSVHNVEKGTQSGSKSVHNSENYIILDSPEEIRKKIKINRNQPIQSDWREDIRKGEEKAVAPIVKKLEEFAEFDWRDGISADPKKGKK